MLICSHFAIFYFFIIVPVTNDLAIRLVLHTCLLRRKHCIVFKAVTLTVSVCLVCILPYYRPPIKICNILLYYVVSAELLSGGLKESKS